MTRRKPLVLGIAGVAVLAGMLLAATPAAAKPPQPPRPTLYEVTVSGSLSTSDATCTADAVLIMRDQDGHLVADGMLGTSVPRLVFETGGADLPWSRSYPIPATGDGFHECHGGGLSATGSRGYLYLYREGGDIVGLMWAFDWYTGTVQAGKRPKEVREYFRTWSITGLQGGTATFVVTYYGPSGITEIGTADLSLTIGVAGPIGS